MKGYVIAIDGRDGLAFSSHGLLRIPYLYLRYYNSAFGKLTPAMTIRACIFILTFASPLLGSSPSRKSHIDRFMIYLHKARTPEYRQFRKHCHDVLVIEPGFKTKLCIQRIQSLGRRKRQPRRLAKLMGQLEKKKGYSILHTNPFHFYIFS